MDTWTEADDELLAAEPTAKAHLTVATRALRVELGRGLRRLAEAWRAGWDRSRKHGDAD